MRLSLLALSVGGLGLGLTLVACEETAPSQTTPSADAGTNDAAAEEKDECPAPTGPGTARPPWPKEDTTWTAAASPYLLDGDLGIAAGVTLTLEPCTVVRIEGGKNINVSGKLVAKGEPGRRVRIEAADPSSPWGWIDTTQKQELPLDFSYTTISGGGATSTGNPGTYTSLRVRAVAGDAPSVPMLRADNLVIEKSASTGLQIVEGAAFTADSKSLTIRGSALHPLTIDPLAAASLPAGDYTGNGKDLIDLSARLPVGLEGVDTAATLRARGVPYRIGSELDGTLRLVLGVSRGSAAIATLTIEPGVAVHFRKDGMLDVAAGDDGHLRGKLVAKGTAEAPIVFTSDAASPAAGDWLGLFFRGRPPAGTAIEHGVIEYAGGEETQTRGFSCGTPPSSDKIATRGAIAFASNIAIESSFVSSTTIRASASNGVDRGWSGEAVDFTATNTFSGIAYCTQTENKSAEGACPSDPSCPPAP